MCTKKYLVLRKREILRLIQQTVHMAVDGADDDNGGCFPGKLEEMRYVIASLHSLADHLGVVLGRLERVTAAEGEIMAIQTISELIFKVVGHSPPTELFESFDPTMN
jgi:hypothetical protein